MSKVIESFLIALGFETDEKGIVQAENAFASLTAQALALGAAAAGMKIFGMASDFADSVDKIGKFSQLTGISAETVDALGYALEREGGAADGAFSALEKMMELMNTPFTGNDGWMEELARAGINPNLVMEARSAEEALAALAGQMAGLSKTQQLQAGHALGLDDATIRLLAKGRGGLSAYIAEAKALGVITKEQTKIADAFKDSQTDLDRVMRDVSHTFSGPMAKSITEATEKFTEWYKVNRDWINLGINDTAEVLADNLGKVATALGLIAGASILGGLSKVAGALGAAKTASVLSGVRGLLMRGGALGASTLIGLEFYEQLKELDINPATAGFLLGGKQGAAAGTALYDWMNSPESESDDSIGGARYPSSARGGSRGRGGNGGGGSTYNDNRLVEIKINGGDTNEVRRVIREEINEMAEQSMLDFSSAVAN
jgi:hypothetical protein